MGVFSKFKDAGEVAILGSCNWTKEHAIKQEAKLVKQKEKENDIHMKWEYYTERLDIKEVDSWKKLRNLEKLLDRFDDLGYRRSRHQREFHRAFIIASLRKIFKDDLNRHMVKLLKEFGISEIRPDVIVCTPRRYGKTTGVGMYSSAWIKSQMGTIVSIYSTGRRASRKLLALIYNMIVKLDGGSSENIPIYNQEALFYRFPDGTMSECWSYPSNVSISILCCVLYVYLGVFGLYHSLPFLTFDVSPPPSSSP